MSIQTEVDRFRSYLTSIDYAYNDIYAICDELTIAINEGVFDIVSGAVDEALDYAISIKADEFVDDIQVLPDASGYYSISSRSGTLDYSKESQRMLPHLLKNAETGSSGNRYKVIPVKGARVQSSMFSMLQQKQDEMDEARIAIRNKAKERKADITGSLQEYALKRTNSISSANKAVESAAGQPNFRTASDKQDPSTSWVLPEKDIDMTSYIHELNSRILTMSDQTVSDIVNSFYKEYGE